MTQYRVMGIANNIKSLTITIEEMADHGWEIDREVETHDPKRVCLIFKRPKDRQCFCSGVGDMCDPCQKLSTKERPKEEKPLGNPDIGYGGVVFCAKDPPKECPCTWRDEGGMRKAVFCPKHDVLQGGIKTSNATMFPKGL